MFQDFIYRCTLLSCSFSGLLMLTFISSLSLHPLENLKICLFCSREFLSLSGSFLQAPSMNHLNHEAMRLMFGFRAAAHPSLCWSFLIFYSYQASTLKSLFKIIWKFKQQNFEGKKVICLLQALNLIEGANSPYYSIYSAFLLYFPAYSHGVPRYFPRYICCGAYDLTSVNKLCSLSLSLSILNLFQFLMRMCLQP